MERNIPTERRVAAVELLLSLGYTWDGEKWNTRPDSGEAVAGLWIGKSECEKPRYGFSSRPALQKLALGNYSLFIHPPTPSPDLSPITALAGKWRERGVKGGSSDICADELQAALTQVGGDARDAQDAARYRWLRDTGINDNGWHINQELSNGMEEIHIFPERLDKAIDAALRGDDEDKP